MYEIIKSVISAGEYKLTEIQHKIKKMYILGDITETQMDELLRLASQGVSFKAERPDVMAMLQSLAARIEALEKNKDEEDDIPAEYEQWTVWDGISDKYQKDSVVSHNDKIWVSVYDGQNVWEPGTAGTENLWVEYTPEAGEE